MIIHSIYEIVVNKIILYQKHLSTDFVAFDEKQKQNNNKMLVFEGIVCYHVYMNEQRRITDKKEFGDLVFSTRKKLGYTQIELSERTGVSRTVIQKIEEHRGTITLDSFFALSDFLGLSVDIYPRTISRTSLADSGIEP